MREIAGAITRRMFDLIIPLPTDDQLQKISS